MINYRKAAADALWTKEGKQLKKFPSPELLNDVLVRGKTSDDYSTAFERAKRKTERFQLPRMHQLISELWLMSYICVDVNDRTQAPRTSITMLRHVCNRSGLVPSGHRIDTDKAFIIELFDLNKTLGPLAAQRILGRKLRLADIEPTIEVLSGLFLGESAQDTINE